MAGTNYFAEFNTNVKISLTNDDDFAVLAECSGNPNVVAVESDRYMPGCIMIRTDYNLGDNLYQNNGTLSIPSWSVIGAGGGPWSSITGTPTEVAYFDASGNGTSDSMFTRDETTKEGQMSFYIYATGQVNDGVSQQVVWIADNVGTGGDDIELVFDGVDDTDTVLAAWNAANPSNTASVLTGTGNFVPTAQTVDFGGAGEAGYFNSNNLFAQDIQVAGIAFVGEGSRLMGVINPGNGESTNFIGAFDFVGNNSILEQRVNELNLSTRNAVDDAGSLIIRDDQVIIRSYIANTSVGGINTTPSFINAWMDGLLGGEYKMLVNNNNVGFISDDGADYTGTIRATGNSTFIKSEDATTGYSNLWQTTTTSAFGVASDGTDSMTLALSPTTFQATGSANGTQITLEDSSYLFSLGDVVLRGNALHNNTDVSQGNATQQDVRSGTYTPTLTGVANVDGTTAYEAQWNRVGNVVTVSGKIGIDPTANNTSTRVRISLPVASNFATEQQCAGTGSNVDSTITAHSARVIADTTNNEAEFGYYETHGTGSEDLTFHFTYVVI